MVFGTGRLNNLIVVLTEGTITIDNSTKEQRDRLEQDRRAAGDVDSISFKGPLYVDCREFNTPLRQTLLDPDFKKVVN